MKAGRELDALIAEKVMGWKYRGYGNGGGEWTFNGQKMAFGGLNGGSLPHYSTNIADAWMVVEKMGRWHGFDFMIVMPDPEQTFHLRTYEAGWYEATNDGPERRVVSDADTAPLAICLAALKAVNQEGQG